MRTKLENQEQVLGNNYTKHLFADINIVKQQKITYPHLIFHRK